MFIIANWWKPAIEEIVAIIRLVRGPTSAIWAISHSESSVCHLPIREALFVAKLKVSIVNSFISPFVSRMMRSGMKSQKGKGFLKVMWEARP